MGKPGLLLWNESYERLLGDALSDRYEVVRAWEWSDADADLTRCGADIVATVTSRLNAGAIAKMPNLRLVVVPAAGYEHIDLKAARSRGAAVTNCGDANSGDVADFAVTLALAALQQLPDMQAWVANGRWARESYPERPSLSAQRFGIVGLGNIGMAMATRLAVLGGEIAWWGRHPKTAPWPRHESLLDLARWCTTLMIATRGDAVGLVNAEVIAAVGPKGLIVNITRGSVLDEDALIAALKSGRLGQAALDVFAREPTPPERWREVPNVILAPHVAGDTHEAMARVRDITIRNLVSILEGRQLLHEITS